ncbi:MAG: hypothetical protein ACI81S_001282 [Sphingobacteriales bacterium]|jgi:uncharacterized protein YyaL (SSP411 family)
MKQIFTLLPLIAVMAACSPTKKSTMNQDHTFTNKLIDEKSPYLLQHAHNPVDWYPWGDEAFDLAKKLDKPIFLSIGYSTCHWCHVMEHESFEDTAVAALMNDAFINIKVDREERPDIDNIYMTVCQMLTGSGGWPLTIVMTPDKKPFYAATYIPKNSRYGRDGMMELIPGLKNAWKTQRNEILENTKRIETGLKKAVLSEPGNIPSSTVFNEAQKSFASRYDAKYGGFGVKPKFPSPHNLIFLLRHGYSTGNQESIEMVENTLENMRLGGIYDQIGFGFHRYSTDKEWLTPHFEKMLYDQAMLVMAYAEAYQVTKNPLFKSTVEEVITYVSRDMTDKKGGFFSAEDADSEGEEGKFYVFSEEELTEIIGESLAEKILPLWGIVKEGNFLDEATGKKTGDNILHWKELPSDQLDAAGVTPDEYEKARKKIFDIREKRIHPYKDDKVLTSWNGLMIAALTKSYEVFGDEKYINLAKGSADFILTNMVNSEGELMHRYRDGEVGILGHAEDYAFFIQGLLGLYETTFETKYLQKAIDLQKVFDAMFWDEKDGGYFFSAVNGEKLIVRQKDQYDGATPSANSTAMMNLVRMGKMLSLPKYDERANELSKLYGEALEQSPTAFSYFLTAYLFTQSPSLEIVFAGKDKKDIGAFLIKMREVYLPFKVTLLNDGGEINKLAPFTKMQLAAGGSPTAYVCQNYACKQPTQDVKVFLEQINSFNE